MVVIAYFVHEITIFSKHKYVSVLLQFGEQQLSRYVL